VNDEITCAWCNEDGDPADMVGSVDRGPNGPIPVFVHIDCLEEWNDRTDPLAGRAK